MLSAVSKSPLFCSSSKVCGIFLNKVLNSPYEITLEFNWIPYISLQGLIPAYLCTQKFSQNTALFCTIIHAILGTGKLSRLSRFRLKFSLLRSETKREEIRFACVSLVQLKYLLQCFASRCFFASIFSHQAEVK